jgi:hypothetical protein
VTASRTKPQQSGDKMYDDGMRFHRAEPNKIWPLTERLWEARRGLAMGIVMSCVAYTPIFLAAYGAKSWLKWHNVLVKLFSDWEFMLLLVVATVFKVWMQELDLVNEESITSEEKIELRLRALEKQVASLTETGRTPERP